MRWTAAWTESPTRSSWSPRAMSRSPPRSARGWSRRASSTSRDHRAGPGPRGDRLGLAMKVGLIGAGNMARAMARGWGDPMLVSDSGSGRAQLLADELGGRAASNVEVAQEAELVVLCHKPYQLRQVAQEIAPHAKAIASVVGGTPVAALQDAYPGTPLFRLMPNTPVEVRRGVIIYSPTSTPWGPADDPELEAAVLELFGRLGWVVNVPDELAS